MYCCVVLTPPGIVTGLGNAIEFVGLPNAIKGLRCKTIMERKSPNAQSGEWYTRYISNVHVGINMRK